MNSEFKPEGFWLLDLGLRVQGLGFRVFTSVLERL
jgi:hypothetical protein